VIHQTCEECQGQPPRPGGAVCGNCRGKGTTPIVVILAEHLGPVMVELSEIYGDWQLGHRPDAGGTNDQAATLVDAIRQLRREFSRIESEEADEREAKLKAAERRQRR